MREVHVREGREKKVGATLGNGNQLPTSRHRKTKYYPSQRCSLSQNFVFKLY